MGRSLQEIVKASARFRVGDSVMRVAGKPVSYIITEVSLRGGLNGNAVVLGAMKGKRRAGDDAVKQITVPASESSVMPNGLSPTRLISSTFKRDWRILIDAEKEMPDRLKYIEKTPEGGFAINRAGVQLIAAGKFPFVGEQTRRAQVGYQLMTQRKAFAAAALAKIEAASAAVADAEAKKAMA